MSYFAILKSADPGIAAPEITDCHINLWQLPELDGGALHFDLGIGIGGSQRAVSFRIAVPFRTVDALSLHSEVLNPATGRLVFGEDVSVDTTTITIGRGKIPSEAVRRFYVAQPTLKRDDAFSTKTGEVWTVDYRRPAVSDGVRGGDAPAYLRIRFKLMQPTMVLQQVDGGWVVDLRIADIRNVRQSDAWNTLEHDLVPLSKAHVFVIVASSLQLTAHHPAFQYIRVLESDVWTDYVKAPLTEKMTVYYWKWPGTIGSGVIKDDNPFRAFLNLTAPVRIQDIARASTLSTALSTTSGVGFGVVAALVVSILVAAAPAIWTLLIESTNSDNPITKGLGGWVVGGIVASVVSVVAVVCWKPLRRGIQKLVAD